MGTPRSHLFFCVVVPSLLWGAGGAGCASAHTRASSEGEVGAASGGTGASAYLATIGERVVYVDRALGAARTASCAEVDGTMAPSTLAAADVYSYPFVAASPDALYWLEVQGGLSVVGAQWDAPAPRAIARGNVGPVGIAVDEGHLFFARMGEVAERFDLLDIDLATGAERIVTRCGGVLGIALDDDAIYATTCRAAGGVWRVPRAGGTPVPLARSTFCPITIAIDDTSVYYADEVDGGSGFEVLRVPKEGGEPALVTRSDGIAFAVQGGFVLAIDDDQLVEVSADGASRRVLVPHVDGGLGVALDDGYAYYTAQDATGALVLRGVTR